MSETNKQLKEYRFYGIGYYEGRELGYKDYQFNGAETEQEYHMYKLGYDAGVADFCNEELGEEA